MESTKMESYVHCPKCGSMLKFILKPIEDELMDMAETISKGLGLGIENTDRFDSGEIKCKCGKSVIVNMTVTAIRYPASPST